MRKSILVAGGVLLLALAAAAGWYVFSPAWTLKAMTDAARAGDDQRLSAYIDYPALRKDMKAELTGQIKAQSHRETSRERKLSLAVALALTGPMVDRMVSPGAMRAALSKLGDAGGKSGGGKSGASGSKRAVAKPRIQRDGVSRFLVTGEGRPDSGLVFERRGLSWKLVGIDLPKGMTADVERK
jgi:hypothetical protein